MLLLAVLVGLAVAGCATGEVEMLVPIAGGERIHVPMGRGGPKPTNEGGVQINAANFTLNADKKLVFIFDFTDSRSRALRQVRVEDVADDAAQLFIDSNQPALSATGQWHGVSEPVDLADPRLGWMATISNTTRVYRFTLTFADGQTLMLYQGTLFPAPIKSAIRHAFGQNY